MTFAEFRNAICILRSIDRSELFDAGVTGPRPEILWGNFSSNPINWLLRASDEDAARVWSIIELRSKRT